jgi:hypothetical protein
MYEREGAFSALRTAHNDAILVVHLRKEIQQRIPHLCSSCWRLIVHGDAELDEAAS